MKSYKQLLSEAISGGKGGPSLGVATDGDFGSIRGLGINTGDSITANLSGKGFGKKQTTKDITPEITAAIKTGKTDGSIEEDENGKLSYRGVNGELHNSPYAANEASTSFVKSTFSSSGVDPKVAEKGAELIVGMKKSGLINYNYKNGKAYIEDMEIGSFDKDSEESMKTFTKSIPSNMMKISITDLQDKLSLMSKRLIARKSDRNQVRTTNEVLNKTNKIVRDMNALSDSQIEEIIPIALEALSQSFYPPFGVNPTIPISPAPESTPPETPDPEDDGSDRIPLPPPIFTPPRHPRSRWGGGGIKGWLWRNIPKLSPRPFRGGGGGAAGVGGLGGRFRWYRDVGYFSIDTPLAQQVSNLLKDLDDLTDDLEKIDSIATSLPPQQQQQQSGPTKHDPTRPARPAAVDPEVPDPTRPGWWRNPTTPWFQPPDYQGPPRNLERPNLDVENPDSLPPTTRDPGDIWDYWRKLYGNWPLPPWLVWDTWNQPDGGPFDRWGNPLPIPPWVPPTEPRPKKLPDGRRYWPGWKFPITPPPGWADDPNPPTEVPPGGSPDGYYPGRYIPTWRRDPDAINPPGTPKPPSPYPPSSYDPDAPWNLPEEPWSEEEYYEYPPEQAQQQQGGPTEIPGKRWIWGDKNSPWSSPGRSVGPRPEFEGEVPTQPAPPENPRDFKRWAYERLQRWYQENPGQTPPPHILDDYLYWDQPEKRRNPRRKGWWRPLF